MASPGLCFTETGTHLKTFEELQLLPQLRRALKEENYSVPTPIQAGTIPAAMDARDILGCAQTGTGKTAAFALPILDYLGRENRRPMPGHPDVLVLAPTRELAIQIADSFKTYGRHLPIRVCQVFGGVSPHQQIQAAKQGAHIMVATPGRLLDLMNQGNIKLDELQVFVLDEADRMMDMGFLPDLKRIISRLPKDRQSLFFSATMPPRIVELSQRLLTDPFTVNVTPKQTSVRKIDQRVMFLDRRAKRPALKQALSSGSVGQALVFTRTKRGANTVARQLTQDGFQAAAIHGNKSQNARQRALEALRTNKIQILVATDVAARGIDIDGITHVINYDMPMEPESYVHRIGRTGRAGAEGVAIAFCTPEERADLRAIERLIGHAVPVDGKKPPEPLPSEMESRPPRRGSPAGSRSRPRRSRNQRPADAEAGDSRAHRGRSEGIRSEFGSRDSRRSNSRRPNSNRSGSRRADSAQSEGRRSASRRFGDGRNESSRSEDGRSERGRSERGHREERSAGHRPRPPAGGSDSSSRHRGGSRERGDSRRSEESIASGTRQRPRRRRFSRHKDHV